MSEDKLEILTVQSNECVRRYSKRAMKASFLPIVSLFLVHGLCIAMKAELDKIFNIGAAKNEKYSDIALGVLVTPFIAIPLVGAIPAESYVKIVGESYIKALIKMYRDSAY